MSKILTAMLAIQRDIHSVGVGKFRKNKDQNFNFRGIDDALLAFSPLISEHGVLLNPAYKLVGVTERATKSGGSTYNAQVELLLEFESAEDGSKRTIGPIYGEANDGQDKGISKAESVAMRQALFLAFLVPHEAVIGGDPDSARIPVDDDREQEKKPAGLPLCDPEKFAGLLPTWQSLIAKGNPQAAPGEPMANYLIAQLRTKYQFTPEQIAAIKGKKEGAQ